MVADVAGRSWGTFKVHVTVQKLPVAVLVEPGYSEATSTTEKRLQFIAAEVYAALAHHSSRPALTSTIAHGSNPSAQGLMNVPKLASPRCASSAGFVLELIHPCADRSTAGRATAAPAAPGRRITLAPYALYIPPANSLVFAVFVSVVNSPNDQLARARCCCRIPRCAKSNTPSFPVHLDSRLVPVPTLCSLASP